MPDWQFEKSAWATGADAVVGIDEAGRGPWAGPVVAGAVVLDPEIIPKDLLSRLDDSKKLKARAREELFGALEGVARIGVGEADVAEIDLIKCLCGWPRTVDSAVQAHEPHRLAFYLQELAAAFHLLWNKGNEDHGLRFIIPEDSRVTAARLTLIGAVAQVIVLGLGIFAVQPVEEMR